LILDSILHLGGFFGCRCGIRGYVVLGPRRVGERRGLRSPNGGGEENNRGEQKSEADWR
jgi:hypothetical protein